MEDIKPTKICEYCQTEFVSSRKDAKFCTNACRTKAYRQRNGIPAPDFTKLSKPRHESIKEQQLQILQDDFQTILISEISLEKKYEEFFERYEQAVENYERSNNQWSRDYLSRKQKEYFDIKHDLFEVDERKRHLQKQIEDLEGEIGRDILLDNELIFTTESIRTMKFATLQFQGKWFEFLGNPLANFHMIAYGLPKSGKTEFAFQFANYLTQFGSVLYINSDEQISPLIQTRIKELNISDIHFSKARQKKEIEYIMQNGRYDFVFIDSCNQAQISISDLEYFRHKHPKIAVIAVFQISIAEKIAGLYSFKNSWDLLVKIERGKANSQDKTRQLGEMEF